jgi:hypothetical protein
VEDTARTAAHVRLTGRFVDGEQRPVADVDIVGGTGGTSATALSDAEGRFELTLEWDIPHANARCWVTARHPRYARRGVRARVAASQGRDLGDIELMPGGTVSGLVTFEEQALAGLEVRLVEADPRTTPGQLGHEPPPMWEHTIDAGTTGEDGRFRIVGAPTMPCYVLTRGPESRWSRSDVFTAAAATELDIGTIGLVALSFSCLLEGFVSDPAGNAVSCELALTLSPTRQNEIQVTTRSKPDGSFDVWLPRAPLPDERLRIVPKDERYEEVTLRTGPYVRDRIVAMFKASRRERELRNRPLIATFPVSRELEVEVVDVDGTPVDTFGWTILVGERRYDYSKKKEHVGGRATIGLPESQATVLIRSPSHSTKLQNFDEGVLPNTVRFELIPRHLVRGIVVSNSGPIEGAEVAIVRHQSSSIEKCLPGFRTGLYTKAGLSTKTDNEGRFWIASVPVGGHYVRARASGYAESFSRQTHGGNADVRVELQAGGIVRGTVRPPPPGSSKIVLYREASFPGDTSLPMSVDVEGRFGVGHVPTGAWLLKIELGSDAVEDRESFTETPRVVVVENNKVTEVDLDRTARPTCVVTGQIRLGGTRSPTALLLLDGERALEIDRCPLDADGSFRLASFAPGTFRLVIEGERSGLRQPQGPVLTDTVELRLGESTRWISDLATVYCRQPR